MKTTLILISTLLLPLSGCGGDPAPTQPRRANAHLVEVTTAEQRKPVIAIKRSGTIEAARVLRLYFQQPGKIEHLPFHEGDEVSKGTLLARLDSKLLNARLQKEQALTRQAKLELERIRTLQDKALVSADELLAARTKLDVAQSSEAVLTTQLEQVRIAAPFDGVVTERLAEPGDVITLTTHVATLVDPRSLQIGLKVSDRTVVKLRKGTPVDIQVDALGQTVFTGKVSRIHPTLSQTDHQAKIEVQFDAIPAAARIGQFCRVTLRPDSSARLLLSAEALRQDTSGAFVFRIVDNKAVRTPVQIGTRTGTDVEITSGLEPGSTVVRKGFLDLRDGKAVKQLEHMGTELILSPNESLSPNNPREAAPD